MNAITRTDFTFEGQKSKYVGKVRDVYDIDDKYLVMVVTDRISAFDVVLPEGIPYKGQVLNQIAAKFLDATADILPNWKLAVPDPMVTVGRKCEPYKVEMVIRGYLSGHAWREYKAGKRTICGVEMPEGMVENQRFPEPIITPTSKAAEGHDEDISKEEIIAGLCKAVAGNYLNNVAKGKKIVAPVVFQGGVSKNAGVVRMFEEELGMPVLVDEKGHLMGAFGIAVLAKECQDEGEFSFDVAEMDFKTREIVCGKCANHCEIICVYRDGKLIDSWGNRCDNGVVR